MNKDDLFRAFDGVDDDILERSETPRRRARPYVRWGALAACLALVLGLGSFAVAAEAKEYNTAVEFFAENGLSTEGLSREDVKAVYRDITTQHFTYDKTAEVLERAVPGWEIDQQGPTPEEVAALWDRNMQLNARPKTGVSYRGEMLNKFDETLGFEVFDKEILECARDGELLWTVEFSDFYVKNCAYTSAGSAVWGGNSTWSSEQPTYGWLARVDDGGNILWQRQLDHGFKNEDISQVVDNGDGTWAVFSRGDFKYLCLSQYDTDGNELSFHKNEVGNLGIWNVVRLGDGYLAQLGNTSDGETARLVKLDRKGNLLDTFTYEGEGCDYYIKDMAEFGGRVYLSAYAVPRQTGESSRHGSGGVLDAEAEGIEYIPPYAVPKRADEVAPYELSGILEYLFDNDIWEIPSEELTPMVRDNYTAVLLLCDPEGGAPETFYSVKGSLGGKLRVNDAGELEWDVESVVDTYFSPYTSSFSIGGTCQVFRYAFDAAGTLVRQEDTGETTPYRR